MSKANQGQRDKGLTRIRKWSPSYIAICLFIGVFALLCVVPVLLVLSVSFTADAAIKQNGYQLIPSVVSFDAYKLLFTNNSDLYRSYGVTISATVVGTLLATAITAMAGYALSNPDVRYRNNVAFFFFIPMVFNAGMVPWYLVCKQLGLVDNFLALIIPSLVFSPFNMFLCRNFMAEIPRSLAESAKLDGANELVIAFRIYAPLSTPVVATVALFYGVAYWNDWFNAIMLVENNKLYPLQYMLYKIQSEINALQRLSPGIPLKKLPGESLKMATVILTIGPIVLFYPFLQKYFVKGLIIGGVKG